MSQRQEPFVSQLTGAVRRTVRSCASAVDPRRQAALERREDGGRLDSSPGGPGPASIDPETGPTNRAEIVERGLSPEEYVRAVLAAHDGRMKQQQLVDDYGWAPSTASRLLSELEERDVVGRYRLGREKVICLPDATPAGVD